MNKIFFLYFNYFATGEGMTTTLGVEIAPNENAAMRAFLKKGILKNSQPNHFEESFKYFSAGTKCFELNADTQPQAVQMVKGYLSTEMSEYIFSANNNGALHEFFFHSYVNYS